MNSEIIRVFGFCTSIQFQLPVIEILVLILTVQIP